MRVWSSEDRFLLASSVFVILLGVRTAQSLVGDDVGLNKIVSIQSRLPAAISAGDVKEIVLPVNTVLDVPLPCSVEGKIRAPATVQSQYIQLRGRDCHKNENDRVIEITNKTNGYSASIFSPKKNIYQTDMIQLIEGENLILVVTEDHLGHTREREILIQYLSKNL